MITEQTVFILGAGASAPYEYPTGAGLKDVICNRYQELYKFLTPQRHTEEDIKYAIENKSSQFIEAYRDAPIDMIDSFLESNANHPYFPQIGKNLIALSILRAEKESKFGLDMTKNQELDWYKNLFNLMYVKGSDGYLAFKENKVDFITFNYDRSLEYFLWHSLRTIYSSLDTRDHTPLDLIPFKFIHVYGKIDNFPWEDPPGNEYKSNYNFTDAVNTADNIKLIHERDGEFLDEIIKLIAEAKNVFFLGFGYDEDNMRALGWPENFNEEKKMFGTAFHMNEDRIRRIRKMLQQGFKNPDLKYRSPFIEPLDCRSLLEKYSNILS